MNTRLLAGLLSLLLLTNLLFSASRDDQWQQVKVANEKGLPKTAIAALEPIIAGALADRAYAEALKALGQKIALEATVEGNKPEEKITRMEAELAKAPAEMKPLMEAIIAQWYWQYFQHNRWRILQRTQTASAPGPYLATWDLTRLLEEIDRHFSAALADEKALQQVPIATYADLLTPGNVPDKYRPTLYDFIAHEALEFYQAGEHGATKAEDEFELDADSSIFADAAAFARWAPAATDSRSPILKAIHLYQRLLEFHRDDADRSAYLDVDLARLSYGFNVAVGEAKVERYSAALEQLAAAHTNHEVSSRALALLAQAAYAAGDPTRAHALAQRALKAFPASNGAALGFNLIQQIEAKSAQIETEQVWNAPWPDIAVTYRNVTKVYFRAVTLDFAERAARSRWNLGQIDYNEASALVSTRPALEWSADLPATTDFVARTERIAAPQSLPPGYYAIVASHDPAFSGRENQLSSTTIWVSELALVTQTRTDQDLQHGFVLRANSGEPVTGAKVRFWRRDQQGRYRADGSETTDQNGRFEFRVKTNDGVVLLAEANGQAVGSPQPINVWRNDPDTADSQTVFFTDRALYRPGQIISYKGISIRYDQTKANYGALRDLDVTVVFNDSNGQEIARASHRTNDYGSFNGTFTAPRDRLLGRMSIQVLGRPSQTTFAVEEYKRPKFQVELTAPTEAANLAALTKLTGKATAYTGAAIGGAKVKWRVERGVQFPSWCWWWQPPAVKAIAHGTAVSAADGTFAIEFTAEPDRSVPEKTEPVFAFTIHADVTDTSGETRSASRSVRAGYTALQAEVTAPEWQTPDAPVELTVTTQSLDGTPQPAKGSITLHALVQPSAVARAAMSGNSHFAGRRGHTQLAAEPPTDPTNPESWALGAQQFEQALTVDATGVAKVKATLPVGIYRATVETADRFGRRVTARNTVEVVDARATAYRVRVPNHFSSPTWSVEPGQKFTALWGTGYSAGRAWVEIECNGRVLKSYWTASTRTQEAIELPVTEEMRGGVTLRVTYVRENRAYFNDRIVDVPWSNHALAVKWETFRSKLLPGQKETWIALVSGPDSQRAAAEIVATLYDASLDQFAPHAWPTGFDVFRRESDRQQAQFHNFSQPFQFVRGGWAVASRSADWRYRSFPEDVRSDVWGWGYVAEDEMVMLSAFSVESREDKGYRAKQSLAGARLGGLLLSAPPVPQQSLQEVAKDESPDGLNHASTPDLTQVTARKNLNETAFFFPSLTAGADGVVRMTFTMPEALTEWKFLGFAHNAKLRAGLLTGKTVTAKNLMVEPNPPRFVREGDAIEFTVKVSNQSDQPQQGKVRLSFADAASLQSVDTQLGLKAPEQAFDVPAKQSRSYTWRITVPDGLGFLTYKAVGATSQASDGEEGFLPVLSRRILVTESLPLPIRGAGTKDFAFTKLLASGQSDTLRSESLTVQMVSQPAWYAVMALPYLMEFPHECSEQLFNRLYANALARHLAQSDPKIRRIFDQWKGTPTLDSPLQKSADLKSVMLEETPWLRQAVKAGEARRNVGLLFDANRLDEESARALRALAERQGDDGLWSWFPGGRTNEFISLYIATGFGRLRHLGLTINVAPAVKAWSALDAWMATRYREIQRGTKPESYVPGSLDALYLYGRSFFLQDQPVAADAKVAVDFFLQQARRFWLQTDSRQSQAHLALALQRFGDATTPVAIMQSIKERSVRSDELGMYWREQELNWWWYRAPIETQAMMIEAFAEITHDEAAVEDCKVWLLKQKQTQDWKTTKATADAIYGLLLRGENLLASDAVVEVSLAGQKLSPAKVEAGTGFYEQKFVREEIKPAMGAIRVKKTDGGVSWGSVHWQYLEDMRKVTPHEGTPLTLKKSLWIKETTARGAVLKPLVNSTATVGDELVVRLELRTDRDLEYVHLKDQRASGTEPVNVLSRYKYQDGLAYYESTRDTASHFFIDYLPKGTYVFEYSTRVQLKGSYQSGIAEIQCMYAPEFNSHSQSFNLEVK